MQVGPNQTLSYFHLTCNFIQRILVINAAGTSKQDGLSAMRIIMTILEQFPGRINDTLPNLVAIMLAELKKAFDEESTPPNYRSMLLQAFSMCFYNNSQITLQTMEQNQMTLPVFINWFTFMNRFKLEFEIRRNVFGLSSLLRTPVEALP